MAIGDSVIAIGDLSMVKVHVHTNQPNKALQYALSLGELDRIKIENMLEQNDYLLTFSDILGGQLFFIPSRPMLDQIAEGELN